VSRNLLERTGVAGDHRRSSAARVTRSMPFSLAFSASRLQQLRSAPRRRKRFRRYFEIAGFHFRHVQNAVDHGKQVLAGIVDQLRIFLAPRRIDHQHVFLGDHFGESMMALSGVRSSWLHGGKEAALGGGRPARRRYARDRAPAPESFGPVTSRITATTSQSVVAGPCSSGRHRISTQMKSAAPRAREVSRRSRNSDAAGFAAAGGVQQRGEISGAVRDMDAVDRPCPSRRDTGVPSNASAAGEMNCTAPLRAVT